MSMGETKDYLIHFDYDIVFFAVAWNWTCELGGCMPVLESTLGDKQHSGFWLVGNQL